MLVTLRVRIKHGNRAAAARRRISRQTLGRARRGAHDRSGRGAAASASTAPTAFAALPRAFRVAARRQPRRRSDSA